MVPLNIGYIGAYTKKLFGENVNLGNIAPHEVIPLECLRLGLRGDTFFNYLPDNVVIEKKQKIEAESK